MCCPRSDSPRRFVLSIVFTFIILTAFLSCQRKNTHIEIPEMVFSIGSDTLISINACVPDINASGLGGSWFLADQFPASELTAFPSSEADYFWYSFKVSSVAGSPDLIMSLRNISDSNILCWLNGSLIEGQNKERSADFSLDLTGNRENPDLITMRLEVTGDDALPLKIRFLPPAEKEATPVPYTVNYPQGLLDGTGIIYKVFLRTFTPNGTFSGLENRLSYIRDLGTDKILLMPVHPTGEPAEGKPFASPYSIQRHFATNYDMGSKDQFLTMKDRAVELGMKVFLETVLDRTSPNHPFVLTNPGYFVRDKEKRILRSDDNIPIGGGLLLLDPYSKSVHEFVKDYFDTWINEYRVDGFALFHSSTFIHDPELRGILRSSGSTIISDLPAGLDTEDIPSIFSMNQSDLFYRAVLAADSSADANELLFNALNRELEYGVAPVHFIENAGTPKARDVLGLQFSGAAFLSLILPGAPLVFSGLELYKAPEMKLDEDNYPNWRNTDDDFTATVAEAAKLRRVLYPENSAVLLEAVDLQKSVFSTIMRSGNGSFLICTNFSGSTFNISEFQGTMLMADPISEITDQGILLAPYGYILLNLTDNSQN